MRFLYKCDYTDDGKEVSAVVFNVRVFAIAEKYFVKGLLTLAASKFRSAAHKLWEEDAFGDAISEMYTITVDADYRLRGELFGVVVKHAKALFDENGMYEHFRLIAADTASFAMEAAQTFTDFMVDQDDKLYACPRNGCKAVFKANFTKGGKLKHRCGGCQNENIMDHKSWQLFVLETGEVLHSA